MLFFRRRLKKREKTEIKEIRPEPDFEITAAAGERILSDNSCFAAHISNYIGETITIFVESGGISGTGFTGVLLFANKVYIELIISICPAPACSLGNPCIMPPVPAYCIGQLRPYNPPYSNLGTSAIIPINKITSFVHNSI